MTKYNKNEALFALYDNKKITNKTLGNFYINIVDGVIVNEKNEKYDFANSKINEWFEWIEPKSTKILTIHEVLTLVYEGGKACVTSWDNKYIYLNKDGAITANDNKNFDIMKYKKSKWIEYKITDDKIKTDDNKIFDLISDKIDNVSSQIDEIFDYNNDKRIDLLSNILEGINNNKKLNLLSDKIDNISNQIDDSFEYKKDGRNPAVRAKNGDILKASYGTDKPDEVKEMFRKQLASCKNTRDVQVTIIQFIPYCWIGDKTIATTSVYYSNLRKIVKEVGGEYEELGLALLIPPAGLYEATSKKVTDNTKTKHAEKDTYDKNHILQSIKDLKNDIDTDSFTVAKQQNIKRVKSYAYSTYLALVTGRRQVEILKTLRIVKKDNEWYYEGLAKKGEEEASILAYSLDTDFEYLNKLLSYVQDEVAAQDVTAEKTNKMYNNSFNSAFKRLTHTNFTFKDAREIYADILYRNYPDAKNTWIDERDFKGKVLGHAPAKEGLVPAEHYMTKEAE